MGVSLQLTTNRRQPTVRAMRLIKLLFVLAILSITAGCASNRPVGKPLTWVDGTGQTNTVAFRYIAHGGIAGPRQGVIVALPLKGNAPAVMSQASGPPLLQSTLGPVSIASGYVWGQSARRPDRNGGSTASASAEGGAGGSAAVQNEIEIKDDPPKGGSKPPWGPKSRGNGPGH